MDIIKKYIKKTRARKKIGLISIYTSTSYIITHDVLMRVSKIVYKITFLVLFLIRNEINLSTFKQQSFSFFSESVIRRWKLKND